MSIKLNRKILVEVYVPAAEESFDVYIPLESKMSQVTDLVSKAMSDLLYGKYIACNDAVLCESKTGHIYDINTVVAELGLKNGSRLLLI